VLDKKKRDMKFATCYKNIKKTINYIKLLSYSKRKAQTYKMAFGKGGPRRDSIE
jgi:hypothetical protein